MGRRRKAGEVGEGGKVEGGRVEERHSVTSHWRYLHMIEVALLSQFGEI